MPGVSLFPAIWSHGARLDPEPMPSLHFGFMALVGICLAGAPLLHGQPAGAPSPASPEALTQAPGAEEPQAPLTLHERNQQRMKSAMERQRASIGRQLARARPSGEAAPTDRTGSPGLGRQLESIRRQADSAQLQAPPAFTRFTLTPPAMTAIEPACEQTTPRQLEQTINLASVREGVAPELLRGVIRRESAYWPCAVSSKGALGLMQLMPQTAADVGVSNPFDPTQSIAGGARYLGMLLRRFDGNLTNALAAYNAGPARVDEFNGLPPFPETRRYVSDILADLSLPAAAEDQAAAQVQAGAQIQVPEAPHLPR